jgi:hypothetical protein
MLGRQAHSHHIDVARTMQKKHTTHTVAWRGPHAKRFHGIVAWRVCWNIFTKPLPSNVLIKSGTVFSFSLHSLLKEKMNLNTRSTCCPVLSLFSVSDYFADFHEAQCELCRVRGASITLVSNIVHSVKTTWLSREHETRKTQVPLASRFCSDIYSTSNKCSGSMQLLLRCFL